jgi:hypothetical protein
MKILFFNGHNICPHLETELELATDFMKSGHEVFFVQCRGELEACFMNFEHKNWICANCEMRKLKALRTIGLPLSNVLPFPDIEINEAVIPERFENIDDLKAFRYEGADIGMGVASSLVSAIRDHRLDTIQYKDRIHKGIRTALFVHECSKVLLADVQPDMAVIFNGRFLEIRPFMRACERMGIPFYTHERGGVLSKYLIREDSTPHSLTAVRKEISELWEKGSENKAELGRKFFEDRRNRVMQSWLVFTEGQEKGSLPEGFDPAKKNIALYNSSIDEYEGIAGFSNKLYEDDNAGIKAIVDSFKDDHSTHFYLRVHPNLSGLDNTQMRELKAIGEAYTNLTIIPPEAVIDSYALMEAASIVAVFSSTMGVEAVYWNKPVVLLSNSFYGGLKGFYQPEDHNQVLALLRSNLSPLESADTLKYGYWELTKGKPYKYFVAQGLDKGTFNGKKIDIGIIQKAINWAIS